MDIVSLYSTEAVQRSGISKHIIGRLANDIIVGDDGYYIFWPTSGAGAFEAWNLRLVADILDELNKPWDNQINEYFNEQSNSSS